MAVSSFRKQLVLLGFFILGAISFVTLLFGFSGSGIVLIANYTGCPSPQLPLGTTPPAGFIPCDTSWKGLHAVLAAQEWNLYACLGNQVWAPSIITYLDRTTSGYTPPCTNTVYFFWTGISGITIESAYVTYEMALKYRGKFVYSFVGAGEPERPLAYANAIFDFLILDRRTPYPAEIFGQLTTSAQVELAKKISAGELYAELVEYVSNDSKGRRLFIYNKHPNEAVNFGEPHTVQIGFFLRKVSGTALVTGVYCGRAVTPIITKTDLEKYGITELPSWQKNKVLALIGEDLNQEEISWYMIDDCDSRRQEVQNAIFKGQKADDKLISVESLNQGKLQAFITFIVNLPFIKKAEIEQQRAEYAEDKLAELEKHGIRIGNFPRGPPKEGFHWPKVPRSLKIVAAVAGLIITFYFALYYLGPYILRYEIQVDLSQISALAQTAPPDIKDQLIKAQSELQQAYTDLNSQGVGALGEARQALFDAGQAIANALTQGTTTTSSASVTSLTHSLSSNSTTTSSRVLP